VKPKRKSRWYEANLIKNYKPLIVQRGVGETSPLRGGVAENPRRNALSRGKVGKKGNERPLHPEKENYLTSLDPGLYRPNRPPFRGRLSSREVLVIEGEGRGGVNESRQRKEVEGGGGSGKPISVQRIRTSHGGGPRTKSDSPRSILEKD